MVVSILYRVINMLTRLLRYKSIVLLLTVGSSSALPMKGGKAYTHEGTICFMCPPGTHIGEHCAVDYQNSLCTPCPPDTFQSHWTQAQTCVACSKECPHDKKSVLTKQCTRIHDIECTCKAGYYLYEVDKFSSIYTCRRHRLCPAGQVVLKNGTSTHDTECGECPVGFYLNRGTCDNITSRSNITTTPACDPKLDADCGHTLNTNSDQYHTTPKTNNEDSQKIMNLHVGVIMICLIFFISIIFAAIYIGTNCKKKTHKKSFSESDESSLPLDSNPEDMNDASESMTSSSTTETGLGTLGEVPSFSELNGTPEWRKELFRFLPKHLSSNWKMFLRNLPGDHQFDSDLDSKLEQIESDYKGIQEQIYQGLTYWCRRNGRTPNPEQVFTALKDICSDRVLISLKELCKTLTENLNKSDV